MVENLKLSDSFKDMQKEIKDKVKGELNALKQAISENSTTNEILSQLKDKELKDVKEKHLRTTAVQMKLKELKYDI